MKFKDLLPGDIVLFKWNQALFHVAIFAPEAGRVSNIIDATSNKGVARSTLEGLYKVLLGCTKTGNLWGLFSNVLEMSVVRSRTLEGQWIADQAEFWRLHGVTYDVKSLANIVETTWEPPVQSSEREEEHNLRVYWAYAARRRTAMIEHPITPGIFSVICSFFLTPLWNLPTAFVNFFVKLIHYLTQTLEKKASEVGVNCVGFVLTVLAAVALKDDRSFELQDAKKKLGCLSKINPARYSLNTVMTEVFSDTNFFEPMGVLDPSVLATQSFNKALLHRERAQDAQATQHLSFA